MPIGTLNTPVQNRFAYGSANVNGSTPRIETQMTNLRPNRSPSAPPDDRAERDRCEEHEQIELRRLAPKRRSGRSNRTCSSSYMLAVIEELREDQRDEDRQRADHRAARQRRARSRARCARIRARPCDTYQRPTPNQQHHRDDCRQPRTTRRSSGRNAARRPPRTAGRSTSRRCRRAETAIARDPAAAGRHPRHARRLRDASTAEPVPTSAAASSDTGSSPRATSNSNPTNVNPMPTRASTAAAGDPCTDADHGLQ